MSITFDAVKRMLSAGMSIVPITPDTKKCLEAGWQSSHYTADDLEKFYPDIRPHGVGLLTGRSLVGGDDTRRLMMLDVDFTHPEASAAILHYIETKWGKVPRRIGKAPKFAVPFLYRDTDGKYTKRTGRYFTKDNIAGRIEVLGEGQQCVIMGTHPDTRLPYTWENNVPWEPSMLMTYCIEGTAKLLEMIAEIDQVLVDVGFTPLGATATEVDRWRVNEPGGKPYPGFGLDMVPELLKVLHTAEPGRVDDYDGWLRVGMALHHQFGGDGSALGLWDDWSSLGSRWESGACTKKWKSFDESGGGGVVTLRSLLFLPGVAAWWRSVGSAYNFTDERAEDDREILGDGSALGYELVSRFVMVGDSSKTVFYDLVMKTLVSKEKLNDLFIRPLVEGADGRPTKDVQPSTLWLKHPKRTKVTGISWSPVSDRVLRYGGKTLFNMYQGIDRVPRVGDVSAWLKICKHIWGEHTEVCLDWLAFTLQHPGKKIKWQMLIVGKERTGKTATVEVIERILEDASGRVTADDFKNGWGNSFARKKFIVCEEMWQPGDRNFYNKVKPLLANEGYRELNMKYGGVFSQANVESYYLLSNHEDALSFNKGDDKLLVIKGPDERLDDCDYAKYFNVLGTLEFQEAVYGFLMRRDVAAFSFGKLPIVTDAALAMSEASEPWFLKKMQDLYDLNEVPFNAQLIRHEDIEGMLNEFKPERIGRVHVNKKMKELGYMQVVCQAATIVNGVRPKATCWTNQEVVHSMSQGDRYNLYRVMFSDKKR